MANKQTAQGGRSTSARKAAAGNVPSNPKSNEPRAPRKTSDKSTSTPAQPRAPKTTSAPKKPAAQGSPKTSTKPPAEKPRVRKIAERPVIARQPGIRQRLGERLGRIARTLQNPAFWRGRIQKLPSWIDEVGALLLIVLGVVMLTALFNTTSEAALSVTLSRVLRQIFGYGAFIIALSLVAVGVIVLLPKFGVVIRLGWTRTIALEVAFVAFTALLHLFANDPESRVLAQEGGGGGYLGWGLTELLAGFGRTVSFCAFGLLLVGAVIVATGLRLYHAALAIGWLRGRLQNSITHLDSMSFEPEQVPDPEPDLDLPPHTLPTARPEQPIQRRPPSGSARSRPAPARRSDAPDEGSLPPRPRNPVQTASDSGPAAEDAENTQPRQELNPALMPDQYGQNGNGQQRPRPTAAPGRTMTRAEKQELVEQTRRLLGGENGRSLVAPGEPGERSSVVPRELLPDSRVVADAPRARTRRRPDEISNRYFTVDDFREVKKIGKRDDHLPPLDLLSATELNKPTEEEINTNARIIKNTLLEFDVETEVIDVKVGPTVTQYAISPYTHQMTEDGEMVLNRVRVSEITNLNGDLALALSAKRLRIQAPVPGHSYVGVEVPNRQPSMVALRPVLETENFYKYRERPLALPLGRDVSGEALVADLATMPHLLIAGTTGSGKSIMLAAMTTAFVMNSTPDRVKLVLLDPKMVELARFNGLPHLLGPVETELDRIIEVLRWATREMDRRYKLLEKEAARNIDTFNKALGRRRKEEQLPYIVIIIDEIGDLMMQRPDETERALTRLAQMARAVGIHLMVATQRPSVDVITGLIKANFPARISFAVASSIDSRVILDSNGAESLMGRGDMLFLAPDASGPRRIQGCYVSDEEVNGVVSYWKKWHAEQIEAERMALPSVAPWERGMTRREVLAETDPMLEAAIALVIAEGEASASLIQRRMGLGYPRAARIVDMLHELGIVGAPKPGGRSREVLVKPGADPFKKLLDKRIKEKDREKPPQDD